MSKFFKQQLKLHWLDLIVVLIIIAIGAVLLWQRAQRKTEWVNVQVRISQAEWWWKAEGPESWLAQAIDPQAVSLNSFGEKVGEVQKVQIIDTGSGRNQIMVWLKLKVNYDPKRDEFNFGFQTLQVGEELEIALGQQIIKSLIVALDKKEVLPVEKVVKLRIGQIDPAVADTYYVGMQAESLEKETLAKITKL